MDDNITIKDQLEEEISNELDQLSTSIEVGSDEHKTKVDTVTKLIDRLNEMDKIDLEYRKLRVSEEAEKNRIQREKTLNEHNEKDQLFKNLISIGSILIPVFVTVWGTYKTLKFEETGTVTTIMGRGFINKLIPKK